MVAMQNIMSARIACNSHPWALCNAHRSDLRYAMGVFSGQPFQATSIHPPRMQLTPTLQHAWRRTSLCRTKRGAEWKSFKAY